MTIIWDVPNDVEPGTYRIKHNGCYRYILGGIYPYQGVSNKFEVMTYYVISARLYSTKKVYIIFFNFNFMQRSLSFILLIKSEYCNCYYCKQIILLLFVYR